MEFLKLIALQLVSPLKFSLLLLLVALILKVANRKRMSRVVNIIAISWILIWSQPYASDLLLHHIEYKPPQYQYPERSPDYIFVLACYYNTQGKVTEISRWAECSLQRNTEAARLHFETQAPLLVTGGNFLNDETVNYGEKAHQFFTSLTIPSEYIITTHRGTNTHEEVISALPHISNKNIWVVSSATHIDRLQHELDGIVASAAYFPVNYHSKGGLSPYFTLPSQSALESAQYGLYEILARVKFKISNSLFLR